MIYEQSSIKRKISEVLLSSIILAVLLSINLLFSNTIGELLWSLLIVLVSLRYGVYYGAVPFLAAMGYTMVHAYNQNTDILIIISDPLFLKEFALYFFLLLFCGLYSLSQKERYIDLTHMFQETKQEKQEIEKTLSEVLDLHEKYKERILNTENSYPVIFEMIQALNHTDPEIIQDEAVKIIRDHFSAEKVVLYHLSRQGKTLRVKLRWGNFENDSSSILVKEAPALLRRALETNEVCFRMPDDDADSPIIAGPVFISGNVRYLLSVNEASLEKLTELDMQWFMWCLRWMGDRLTFAYRYEREVYKHDRFPGTNIYKMEAFFHRLSVEIDRMKKLGQPFASFDLEVSHSDLREIEFILEEQLRETDLSGYDEHSKKLYILLPGTSKDYTSKVKNRIKEALAQNVGAGK